MTISVEITVRFIITNIVDESELEEFYKGNLSDCVLDAIQSDGLFGIIDDDYKIIEIRRGDE